jgi:cytochrome c oxidase subunit 3
MNFTKTEELQRSEKSKLALLYVSIASMTMVFAGLTSAYIVRKGEGNWMLFEIPFQFYISTALLLFSSISLNFGMSYLKKGDILFLGRLLAVTLALGLAFGYFQFSGWHSLVESGVYFAGKTANASGSFFYVITWLHFGHYIGGIIALVFGIWRNHSGAYAAGNYTGMKMIAAYWHFLDALWLYIFLFLLLYK